MSRRRKHPHRPRIADDPNQEIRISTRSVANPDGGLTTLFTVESRCLGFSQGLITLDSLEQVEGLRQCLDSFISRHLWAPLPFSTTTFRSPDYPEIPAASEPEAPYGRE